MPNDIERLSAQRDRFRTALAALVGAESVDELRQMKAALLAMAVLNEDKTAMLNAINALMEQDVIAEMPKPVCICGGEPHVSACPANTDPFLKGFL